MRYAKWLLITAALCLSAPVLASTTAAWAASDREMARACTKASTLKNAQPVSKIMLFSDRVGYSALLLQGRYPQKHMKNQRGRELCLYHRATKRASVTEADDLTARSQ